MKFFLLVNVVLGFQLQRGARGVHQLPVCYFCLVVTDFMKGACRSKEQDDHFDGTGRGFKRLSVI